MICFDTGPVIWGVQGVARPGQEGMIGRTKRYIRFLADQGQRIMLPAPVVEEYLLGFNPDEQPKQLEIIQQSFFVPSLDAPSAALAA